MMRLPEDIFKECTEIMGGKRHDYVSGPVHENFERSAEVSSWFKYDKDRVYVTLIATKLARLATLLGNKNPRNESIRDTFKDLINYSALWADSRDERDLDEGAQSFLNEVAGLGKSYTESVTKPAALENLGKQIDMSINAFGKMVNLAETLTDQHLIEMADYLYQVKARRQQTNRP